MSQFLISILMLIAGVVATHFASSYTDAFTGYVVPDLILDHIPTIAVGAIFFQGAAIFTVLLVGILLANPKYFPFVFEASAAFFFVRSLFMMMTHLSAPVIEYYSYMKSEPFMEQALFTLSSGNDLFFSGHTGFPALLMFIYWKNRPLRYFFLACSVVGAIAVLLGHLHYSIDVFSAYFIAYGIYSISKKLFHHGYNLIHE